ncbi:MAG: intradiol ring-cleavage dioxygenase [Solirubrobacterales bacterium]
MSRRLSRREAIAAGGGIALGAAGLGLGCGEDDPAAATPTTTAGGRGDGCVLTPQQSEGPYYVDEAMVRRDIRGGRDGAELELLLGVQDAAGCKPIPGATVEVWHADAEGVYSAFGAGTGEAFLRGAQKTGRDGLALFTTIYPGWYPGRAVHLHVKVHVRGEEVHTGQLYFDEEVTDEVHQADPYASRGQRDTTNDADGLFAAGGATSVLAVRPNGDGYSGEITMTVAA